MSSLLSRKSELAKAEEQIRQIENPEFELPKFGDKMQEAGLLPLSPLGLEVFQVNVGKMCNQACHHCHVDAGPDRKEIMTQEIMQQCIDVVAKYSIRKVDLTGGAPEMNPHFRWFVTELRKAGAHILNRCNLTIILANEKYHDLPLFFKQHQVEVVSSLPHFSKSRTDRQRGDGVFDKSIKALQRLNEVGYGQDGTQLKLNLVYNPAGSFLPGDQQALEQEFKKTLYSEFGIEFNNLYCITNMPISRYLEYLIKSGNYQSYMTTLVNAFNPVAAQAVMCRNTISVGWDGQLYDCDFNQMLGLPVAKNAPQTLQEFDLSALAKRNIILGQHCYGCTAGSGSSCGGSVA